MGNFRSDSRSGGFRDRAGGGGFGGGRSFGGDRGERSGGFGGRDRDSGRSRGGFGGGRSFGGDRPRAEMHDATCSDCGKACQVPFRPTGSKPVRCSDCFRKEGGGNDRSGSRGGASQSGISPEQFKQLNTKLDKIISILDQIEFEDIGEEGEEEAEEEEEEVVEEEEKGKEEESE